MYIQTQSRAFLGTSPDHNDFIFNDHSEEFVYQRNIRDPRFGDVSLLQNRKNGKIIALEVFNVEDTRELKNQVQEAKEKLALVNSNLMGLIDCTMKENRKLCSANYTLKFYYDFPKTDLKKEIQRRKKAENHFSAKELLFILKDISEANAYLQKQGFYHGDLNPLMVAYDNKDKRSKLILTELLKKDSQLGLQFQKNRILSGNVLYQSPRLFQIANEIGRAHV